VRVALGGADLGMAEQLSDHLERSAPRNQQRGEGVAQIVNAVTGMSACSRIRAQSRFSSITG